jgi:hypothetical protein
MPFIERRVFFAKVGTSDGLVDHVKGGIGLFLNSIEIWSIR